VGARKAEVTVLPLFGCIYNVRHLLGFHETRIWLIYAMKQNKRGSIYYPGFHHCCPYMELFCQFIQGKSLQFNGHEDNN
jgi:hypothetical protein